MNPSPVIIRDDLDIQLRYNGSDIRSVEFNHKVMAVYTYFRDKMKISFLNQHETKDGAAANASAFNATPTAHNSKSNEERSEEPGYAVLSQSPFLVYLTEKELVVDALRDHEGDKHDKDDIVYDISNTANAVNALSLDIQSSDNNISSSTLLEEETKQNDQFPISSTSSISSSSSDATILATSSNSNKTNNLFRVELLPSMKSMIEIDLAESVNDIKTTSNFHVQFSPDYHFLILYFSQDRTAVFILEFEKCLSMERQIYGSEMWTPLNCSKLKPQNEILQNGIVMISNNPKFNTQLTSFGSLAEDSSKWTFSKVSKSYPFVYSLTNTGYNAPNSQNDSPQQPRIFYNILGLVTKYGIEIYKLNVTLGTFPEKPEVLSIKKTSTVFKCCWNHPKDPLFIVASQNPDKPSQCELRPYRLLLDGSLTKMATYFLPETEYMYPNYEDLSIAQIYTDTYCIILDPDSLEFQLFRLTDNSFELTKCYKVFSATVPRFGTNIIDNMLCLYNPETKVTLIFDIKDDTDYPICYPLPLTSQVKTENDANAILEQSSNDIENWSHVYPDMIIDLSTGKVFKLLIDLRLFIPFSTQLSNPKGIVGAMLRRSSSYPQSQREQFRYCHMFPKSYAKFVLLEYLSDMISQFVIEEQDETLYKRIQTIFESINEIYLVGLLQVNTRSPSPFADISSTEMKLEIPSDGQLGDYRLSDGKAICLQHDFLYSVIAPVIRKILRARDAIVIENDLRLTQIANLTHPECEILSRIVTEYVFSLHALAIPVDNIITDLLAKMLCHIKNYRQVYQLLQYLVLTDSIPLAEFLLNESQYYPPFWQSSVDILKRLHAYARIVRELLQKDRIALAISVAIENPFETIKFVEKVEVDLSVKEQFESITPKKRGYQQTLPSSSENTEKDFSHLHAPISLVEFFESACMIITRNPDSDPSIIFNRLLGFFQIIDPEIIATQGGKPSRLARLIDMKCMKVIASIIQENEELLHSFKQSFGFHDLI